MKIATLLALREAIAPALAESRAAATAATTLESYDLPARVRNRLEDVERTLARAIAEMAANEMEGRGA